MDQTSDLAFAAIGKNMAVGGGSSALVFGLTANELAAYGGLLIAIVGVVIQWYYKRKADRREAEYHTTRMKDLRRDG